MGPLYPDDMISISLCFQLPTGGLAFDVQFLFAFKSAILIHTMCGRPHGVPGGLPLVSFPSLSVSCMFLLDSSRCVCISWTYRHVCGTPSVFGGCVFPFYCFFSLLLSRFFLHPDFHYTICCVLKTAGFHYGLMYVKISLP